MVSLISANEELYRRMLADISSARRYVYLETYIFGDDGVGRSFRDALRAKADEGVDVRLLVDSVGSSLKRRFFEGLDARFARRLRFLPWRLAENHLRNHRKLLVIDDRVAYIGSSNVGAEMLSWREANLRLTGSVAKLAREAFLDSYAIANAHAFRKRHHLKPLTHAGWTIVRDIPVPWASPIRRRHLEMVRSARRSITIESAYFLPDRIFRRELRRAAARGVEVRVLIPLRSDVRVVDILRERYLGRLHEHGIRIAYYEGGILHSKLMLVDGERFSIGSANLDRRSSLHQFELNLIGAHRGAASAIASHARTTAAGSRPFDYDAWASRPWISRLLEQALRPIKTLL